MYELSNGDEIYISRHRKLSRLWESIWRNFGDGTWNPHGTEVITCDGNPITEAQKREIYDYLED